MVPRLSIALNSSTTLLSTGPVRAKTVHTSVISQSISDNISSIIVVMEGGGTKNGLACPMQRKYVTMAPLNFNGEATYKIAN